MNVSPSPGHASPNIRHRFSTIRFVFRQWALIVQIVLTTPRRPLGIATVRRSASTCSGARRHGPAQSPELAEILVGPKHPSDLAPDELAIRFADLPSGDSDTDRVRSSDQRMEIWRGPAFGNQHRPSQVIAVFGERGQICPTVPPGGETGAVAKADDNRRIGHCGGVYGLHSSLSYSTYQPSAVRPLNPEPVGRVQYHPGSRKAPRPAYTSRLEEQEIQRGRSPSCFAPVPTSSDCFRQATVSARCCHRRSAGQGRRGTVRRDRPPRRSANRNCSWKAARRSKARRQGRLSRARNDSRHNCPGSGRSRGSPRRSWGSTACSSVFRRGSRCSSAYRASTSRSSSCPRSRRNTRTPTGGGHGPAGIPSRPWTTC